MCDIRPSVALWNKLGFLPIKKLRFFFKYLKGVCDEIKGSEIL